ncbi:hypothetical protein TUM17378_19620 [Shewanella algae]|nr:hypothetical protein TUM17378_19620 [Shewanella algae]
MVGRRTITRVKSALKLKDLTKMHDNAKVPNQLLQLQDTVFTEFCDIEQDSVSPLIAELCL